MLYYFEHAALREAYREKNRCISLFAFIILLAGLRPFYLEPFLVRDQSNGNPKNVAKIVVSNQPEVLHRQSAP